MVVHYHKFSSPCDVVMMNGCSSLNGGRCNLVSFVTCEVIDNFSTSDGFPYLEIH